MNLKQTKCDQTVHEKWCAPLLPDDMIVFVLTK